MKKLFIYTENYARGGGNRYMIDMVNSIYGLFDEVMVTCNPGGIYDSDIKRLKKKLKKENIPVITRHRLIFSLRTKSRLVEYSIKLLTLLIEPLMFIYNVALFMIILRNTKPALIMACNGGYPAALSTLALVVAAKIRGVPAILSIVSVPSQRKFRSLIPDRLLDAIVCQCASAVIVNAREIANKLVMWRKMPPEKIHVLYNGLDSTIPTCEKLVGLSNKTTIGLVARLDYAKGVDYLLSAFIDIHQIYPDTHLVLVGEGDAYNDIVTTIRSSGIQDCVSMLGYYDGDVQSLIASFDIYVFPSLHEGFPYSVLEAMRSGCAIVASEVGGIPEAIRDYEDGLLVKPSSIEELVNAIERLLTDEPLRLKLGKQAQQRFLETFTLDEMEVQLKQFVESYINIGH